MTAWSVTLRGIRHRPGRSLIVLLLAAVAVTAAVLAPAYARAAEQSVLIDAVRAAPPDLTGLLVSAQGDKSIAPAAYESVDEARATGGGALARHPALRAAFGVPIASVDSEALFASGGEALSGRLAYRAGACAHLVVTGRCPSQPGEVVVSTRTAEQYGLHPGQRLSLQPGGAAPPTTARPDLVTVIGTYSVRDPGDPYWGRTAYFSSGYTGPDGASTRVDTLFAGTEDAARPWAPTAEARLRLEYPLQPAAIRLDDVPALRRDLTQLGRELAGRGLQVTSVLPSVLDDAAAEQVAIGRTVPIVAIPLVLLALVVLFLLVASVSEERAPELALAKLRGYPLGLANRFGLGEALFLVVAAGPLGLLLGLLLVRAVGWFVFASGTPVELRLPVLGAALAAVLAGAAAAVLASLRTLGQPVLALLRRVPSRSRWRTTVGEGAVLALAGAVLFQAWRDRASPLALLAPAMVALVAGLIVARLLAVSARLLLGRARRRGRIAGLLAAAQLGRRRGGHRIAVVLTVAVALLTFGATAADVAAGARAERARAALGADRVFTVDAAHPDALIAAVAKADPAGTSMAVVRASERYGDNDVELVGVESEKLGRVAVWPGQSAADIQRIGTALHPATASPLMVRGRLAAQVTVSALTTAAPLRLVAVVSAPGEPPRSLTLGTLSAPPEGYSDHGAQTTSPQTVTMSAPAPRCADGCRLLGLGVARTPGTTDPVTVDLSIGTLISGGGDLDAGFSDGSRWRWTQSRAPQASVTLTPGDALRMQVRSSDPGDVIAEYADAPSTLPVVVAGGAPADDPNARTFSFQALGDRPQPFRPIAHTGVLPRAGTHGLLFDLEDAVRVAERDTSLADADTLRYEVWASPDAPADLAQRLDAVGARVLTTDSIVRYTDRLDRRAPALALRLYLLAGGAAVVLALGAVLLTAHVGAGTRLREAAALRVTGVPRSVLGRGLVREYRTLLTGPLIVGVLAGLGGAVLMLPGIPLVTVNDRGGGRLTDALGPGWLAGALVVLVLGLLLVVVTVLRTLRRATPDRLREGV